MCELGKILRVFSNVPRPRPLRAPRKVETPAEEPEREMVPVRRIKSDQHERQEQS